MHRYFSKLNLGFPYSFRMGFSLSIVTTPDSLAIDWWSIMDNRQIVDFIAQGKFMGI